MATGQRGSSADRLTVVAGSGALLVAVFLVALNLRTGFGSLPPMLTTIQARLGLSDTAAGLLTTIPPLCLGVFAPLAPWLARRWSLEAAIAMGLGLSLIGTAVRSVGGSAGLFIGTVLVGAGPAVIGVLLPQLVKDRFPDRPGAVTGAYSMALVGGATLGAASTYELSTGLFDGSWALGLAFWTLPVVLALLVWAPQLRAATPATEPPRPAVRLLRTPLAWAVTTFMGFQALYFYVTLSWFAAILESEGVSPGRAALLLGLTNLVQIPFALAAPVLAGRLRSQSALAAGAVGLSTAGFLGLLAAPVSGAIVWAVLLGIGQGAAIAVAMTVIVLRSPDSASTGRLSGMVQGFGYLLAATGPVLVGAVHDATGSWTAPLWLLVGLTVPGAIAGVLAGRPRQISR